MGEWPKVKDMEIALLETLYELGGQAQTPYIYKEMTTKFPELTKEQIESKQKNGTTKVWWNRIQWIRQTLVHNGELMGVGHGKWRITDKGLERIHKSF